MGTRKAGVLVDCGASVTLISPVISAGIKKLLNDTKITLTFWERSYCSDDMEGMFMAFAATDNTKLNKQIYEDARKRQILCNIADQPDLCDFTLPSIVRRKDLMLTISTMGKSPGLSKKLRKKLEAQFGSEYGSLLDLAGAFRRKVIEENLLNSECRQDFFKELISDSMIDMIRHKEIEKIESLLTGYLGNGHDIRSMIEEYFKKK